MFKKNFIFWISFVLLAILFFVFSVFSMYWVEVAIKRLVVYFGIKACCPQVKLISFLTGCVVVIFYAVVLAKIFLFKLVPELIKIKN